MLDLLGEPRHRNQVAAREGCPTALFTGDLGGGGFAGGGHVDADAFVASASFDNATTFDGEGVGGDRTRDDDLTEPPGGFDHHSSAPGDRVEGERDTCGVGGDHALHHDRQGDVVVGESLLVAVGDGPVAPQRRPAAAHRLDNGVPAGHPQIGFLLTREGRVREVLGGGRGTHRDRPVEVSRGVADPLGQSVGQRGGRDEFPQPVVVPGLQ